MHRARFLVPLLAALALGFRASADTTSLIILSKDAGGTLANANLSLTLTPNAASDQTQALIPAGSKLLSDQLVYGIDANGLGVFHGAARIVTPDGKTYFGGELNGTIGLASTRDAGKDARLAHHWVGILTREASNTAADPSAVPPAVWEVHFAGDDTPAATANTLPAFHGRLDGLIGAPPPPPPPAGHVTVVTDKKVYGLTDPVVVTISNGLKTAIQVVNGGSFCTVVQLQRQDGQQWKTVDPCATAGAAATKTIIAAGASLAVTLPPDPTVKPSWMAGNFRAAIEFNIGDATASNALVVANSAPFRIGAPPPKAESSTSGASTSAS